MSGVAAHAPSLLVRGKSLSPPPNSPSRSSMASSSVRIAVVGDVFVNANANQCPLKHDDWSLREDAIALHFLKPDLVLFTGDFGNGNVEVVRSIMKLDMAKAVILGNHDSFLTRKTPRKVKDPVQLQLESLGPVHVGYKRLDFCTSKLSVVGGRPFSHGGGELFQKRLLTARYGVHDMNGSAKKIYEAAIGTPDDHFTIILAHNGPTGLGSDIHDICGRDWMFDGGDHGDPDLAQAISHLKEASSIAMPLVVFGHMHKELAHGKGQRRMIVVGLDNTIYLNGAIVPRVKVMDTCDKSLMDTGRGSRPQSTTSTTRAFTIVEILIGRVEKIAETWVCVSGDNATLEEEHVLFGSG